MIIYNSQKNEIVTEIKLLRLNMKNINKNEICINNYFLKLKK